MRCPIETGEGQRLLDRALPAALEDHIRDCRACSDLSGAHASVNRALDLWEAPAISADFDRRLYRRIESDVGPPGVHLSRDAQCVRGSIEEVRVPEGDVARTRRELLLDVAQHRFARNRDEPPTVDRNDGAVAAQMLASARGFDRRYQPLLSSDVEVRVAVEHGKPGAAGDGDRSFLAQQVGRAARGSHAGNGRPVTMLQRFGEQAQWNVRFAADHEFGVAVQQMVGIQLRVETEETDVRAGRCVLRHADSKPQCRVHRDRNGDQPRTR